VSNSGQIYPADDAGQPEAPPAEASGAAPAAPDAPKRTPIAGTDARLEKLVANVQDALLALPIYFQTSTSIEGLEAGDLFSLNSVLGGTIEVQTVATLNKIRDVWDPDEEWSEYYFERSSQSFPDVRLVTRSPGKPSPVLGIELKGWYLLSKEGEPSFRYTASRNAATIYDLLVVVPWRLSNVLSGVPVVYEPFIEQAQYAADLRNHYWNHLRGDAATPGVESPASAVPYAPPKTKVSDKPVSDSGGNFGRVARVPGLMKEYCARLLETRVAGIDAKHWVSFFKTYSDNANSADVDATIERAMKAARKDFDAARAEEMGAVLRRLAELTNGDPIA
jgi:hypothetical protein